MSPQPDQDIDRSVLSWESVLDANDTETKTDTDGTPGNAPGAAPTPAAAPAPGADPARAAAPAPLGATSLPGPEDIELSIAPLSLDPLSLDPLPPIIDTSERAATVDAGTADVLGGMHLELPQLNLDARQADPLEPAAAVAADVEEIDLTIAPLDLPDLTRTGPVPTVVPAAVAAPELHVAGESAPVEESPAPDAAPQSVAAPVADAPADIASSSPSTSEQSQLAASESASQQSHEVTESVTRTPAGLAGLPDDEVPFDASPTTVVSQPAPVPPPAAPSVAVAASTPNVPSRQPNQAALPRVAAPAARTPEEPAQPARRDRKHQEKLQKQQQKVALKKVKASTARSGAGGVALFFTLLVLVGLIAGAIIFGRPYLFPDEWEDAARPYGEAVETARGADIAEPLMVQRRAADVFATAMTAQVVGPWESELPTWRSLGLISGSVDAALLRKLVEDWSAAYYSPETGEVIANDAVDSVVVDAALAEAMAAAALDQETNWSSSLDDTLLDAPALTRAIVAASSRSAADATIFGAVDNSVRDIGVSTFLPPVLEYRVNAPSAFAEFSTDDPTQRSADFEALRLASLLQASGEPELAAGDTILSIQQLTDRSYWYLVFASYTDAATAYAASNDLVQASLTKADSAGTACTYATFSGTDVAGTSRVSNVLEAWVAAVPAEMTATVQTLPNGTMQLRSCDPGVAFESGARFGVGREIARFRSVELAAVAAIPVVEGATADRAAAIADVRESQVALAMAELAFDASFADSADQARALVGPEPGAETPADASDGETIDQGE